MGCSLIPEPKIQTVTKTVKTVVPIVAHPKQVKLNDVKIYVVSKANYETFIKEYEAKNGADSYIAISVKDNLFALSTISEIVFFPSVHVECICRSVKKYDRFISLYFLNVNFIIY